MAETPRGAGVLFYDRERERVLLYRRDSTPSIPFPGYLDILGGHTEPGETPEETAVREIAKSWRTCGAAAPSSSPPIGSSPSTRMRVG